MNLSEQMYKEFCEQDAALKRIIQLLVKYAGMTPVEAIRFVLWLD